MGFNHSHDSMMIDRGDNLGLADSVRDATETLDEERMMLTDSSRLGTIWDADLRTMNCGGCRASSLLEWAMKLRAWGTDRGQIGEYTWYPKKRGNTRIPTILWVLDWFQRLQCPKRTL